MQKWIVNLWHVLGCSPCRRWPNAASKLSEHAERPPHESRAHAWHTNRHTEREQAESKMALRQARHDFKSYSLTTRTRYLAFTPLHLGQARVRVRTRAVSLPSTHLAVVRDPLDEEGRVLVHHVGDLVVDLLRGELAAESDRARKVLACGVRTKDESEEGKRGERSTGVAWSVLCVVRRLNQPDTWYRL